MASNVVSQTNKKIKNKIVEFSNSVIRSHQMAKVALETSDKKLAMEAIERHNVLRQRYSSIKSDLAFAIAKAPVTIELRRILSYLSIASELLRLGKYATIISKFILITEKIDKSSIKRILNIHTPLREMLNDVPKMIDKEDVDLYERIAAKDEMVGEMTTKTRTSIIESIATKSSKREIGQRLFVMNVVNAIERAAAHVVNIGESTNYIVSGEMNHS